MGKEKKTSWLKWGIRSWIGWKSLEYVIHHPHFIRDLKATGKEYITNIGELFDSIQSLKANSSQLQIELKKTEKTVNQINRSVDRFQYKLEPRMEKINELQEHISNEINRIQDQTLDKKRK